jgi:hypothetical protein
MAKLSIVGKRSWTDAERLDAIAPLLKGRCTEERITARAIEVGVSSRSLHRWIAAHEGRTPGTWFKVAFPVAAVFVTLRHSEGATVRAIHELLASEWANLYPGKKCPSYRTLVGFVASLPPRSKPVQR